MYYGPAGHNYCVVQLAPRSSYTDRSQLRYGKFLLVTSVYELPQMLVIPSV